MIARLSSEVFYISTRKLLGAFYVDQKKKGLLPNTLPPEHEQWGANSHGWVAFPVAFTSFRRILTNHQGSTFMQSKVVEIDSLTGFTLDVDTNSSENYDAQWIAIGR